MSCGAEPGTSSGASGGSGDEKDKDMDSSHQVNASEEDSYSNESGMTDNSYSEGENSTPRTSPRGAKESGRRRKNTNRISYSDLSYPNSLSRQEKRRIEEEIIKGRKLGEWKSVI